MVVKLDEISRAIGAIETSIKTQDARSAEDRVTADRRHDENQKAIGDVRQDMQRAMSELSTTASTRWEATTDALNELRSDLLAHAVAVSTIQPQVAAIQPQIAALQTSRSRLVALATIGLIVIIGFVEGAKAVLVAGLAWGFKKFGG